MSFRVALVVCLFTTSAHAEPEPLAVRAFHSQKCLANIGKAGVADCTDANRLTLLPVDTHKVMLRADGNHCLFSNKDGRFAWYGCTPSYNDQHWEIVPPDANTTSTVKQAGDGWRMLKSVHSGKCLFSNKDGRFGIYTCTAKFDDQYWQVTGGSAPQPVKVAKTVQPMSDADFQTIVGAIQAESFSADQLGALELGKKDKLFSVAQVGTLVDLFSFSADKLAALKAVRTQIADRKNEVQLLEKFTFSEDKANARKILAE